MDSALRLHGSSLAKAYVSFTEGDPGPATLVRVQEEGAVPGVRGHQARSSGSLARRRVDHLSHWRYSIKPRPGSRWRGLLHVKVKTARGFSGAVVASVMRGRKPPNHVALKVSRRGVARGVVPLGGERARSVMITLVNSSWEPSQCDLGTRYTCGGVFPEDDTKLRVQVRATHR